MARSRQLNANPLGCSSHLRSDTHVICSSPNTSSPTNREVPMRFQRHDGKLLITPTPGYTPHIGVLVSTMQRCRETTILLVQDLTVEQLDYLFDDEDNSIGALLLHLGALEAGYQEITFFN